MNVAEDHVHSCEEFIYREATSADYEAVLDINRDLYDGLDYLEHCYEEFMENPNYYCFLGETSQRKVVVFMFMCVLDDGRTVYSGAERSHLDYRGRRLGDRLWIYAHNFMTARYPYLSRYLIIAIENETRIRWLRKYADYWRVIERRHVASFKSTIDQVNVLLTTDLFKQHSDTLRLNLVRQISKTEAVQLLTDRDHQTMPDIKLALLFSGLSSTEQHSGQRLQRTAANSAIVLVSNAAELAISFVYPLVRCKFGFRYHVEFYGTQDLDAQRHLLACLKYLSTLEESGGNVAILFSYPAGNNQSTLDQALEGICDVFNFEAGPWTGTDRRFATFENFRPFEFASKLGIELKARTDDVLAKL